MLSLSKIASSSNIPRRSSRIAALQEHKKDNLSKFKSSPLSSISVSKSPETSIPAQNHSANSGESKEEEVKFASKSNDCYVPHPNRNSNLLPSDNRNKKEKLQLPSPNDPEWKVIDKELWNALPRIFLSFSLFPLVCYATEGLVFSFYYQLLMLRIIFLELV